MAQNTSNAVMAQRVEAHDSRGSKIPFSNLTFAAKRVGRPRDPNGERANKPWLAEGISQRTYYRRKADAAAAAPAPPQQHSAQVTAWYGTRTACERMDYHGLIRRSLTPPKPPLGKICEAYANARGLS